MRSALNLSDIGKDVDIVHDKTTEFFTGEIEAKYAVRFIETQFYLKMIFKILQQT